MERKEESPSMRREWIEIPSTSGSPATDVSPSMRREWIEMHKSSQLFPTNRRLPPCGGSGLKSSLFYFGFWAFPSPSMRREWIEMK